MVLILRFLYYFNLAKNYDFTFEPRYIAKRGEGGFSKFRYLSKNYSGYIESSFLSENDKYINKTSDKSFRWSFNFIHNAKILKNYFLKIKYSNLGDSLFLRDFGGSFNGQSDQLFVPQKIQIANFGKNYNFSATVNAFKLTSPIGVNQFQALPEIKFNYFLNYQNFDFNLKPTINLLEREDLSLKIQNKGLKNLKLSLNFYFIRVFLI